MIVLTISKYVLLLTSGGIDSTTCIAYYIDRGYTVSGLFIDFGQASASQELASAKAVSRYYNINLEIVGCRGCGEHKEGFIVGRNAFLLFTALMKFGQKSGIISMAIHAGTPYIDCSEKFIETIQASFDLYTDGIVVVDAPFIRWTKLEIWNYALQHKVPVNLTYSCECGKQQPCGACSSCKDLEALYASQK